MRSGPARPRFRLNRRRVAAALAALAGIIAALVLLARVVFPPKPPEPFRPRPAEAVIAPPAPQLVEEKIVIPARSTLAEILKRRGFNDREIHDLRESVKPVYDLSRIRAGQELRLASLPDGPWRRLEYDIDETRYLAVRNDGDGVHAEMKDVPVS